MAQKLITLGADVNHQDDNTKYSPLMWGAIKGHMGIVATCLKANADLNLQDRVSVCLCYWFLCCEEFDWSLLDRQAPLQLCMPHHKAILKL